MKTICIKTNNSDAINYLLKNLQELDLADVHFSCHKFKIFTNIFIHYKGIQIDVFISTVVNMLVFLILDIYENKIIKKILQNEYFYFDINERNEILNRYQNILHDEDNQLSSFTQDLLFNIFRSYLKHNNKIYLKGFVTFRLKDYINELENTIDEAVNYYLIDKEYLEFIELLRLYVDSEESKINLVHLFYGKNTIKLLDDKNNKINIDSDLLNTKFLSDISFSSADMVLNTLLNLVPKKIYIHLEQDNNDEFITTLQKIFENRVSFYK